MREYRTTLRMTIMKSNEPAKTKKAMKTMNFLSMAALALVGAMMTGCSNDGNIIDEPQQPVNMNNVVTLTATVGFDETSTTRALTSGGVKTFAVGEKIAVVYKSGGSTLKAESAVLKAGDIASGNKLATFTFELTSPDKTQDVTYIYPASMANADGTVNYDALATQDGTMTSLSNNLDLATYTAAWTDASLPTGTLTNQLAVCALTLKNSTGSSPITSGLTQVTISDGTNSYLIAPESSTFGEDVIYVAIRPVTAALQYTASDGTNNYIKTATSREYAAGNLYNLGLRMVIPSFTINGSGTKVVFAPGNLQYNDSETTYKWRFAANQYDYVGAWDITTWVDLLGWGTWTGSSPNPLNTSKTPGDYSWNSSDFTQESLLADATQRSYNWRTLTYSEWNYIIESRTTTTTNMPTGTNSGNAKYTKATVAGVEGVILFPDNYAHPAGTTVSVSSAAYNNTEDNAFTTFTVDAANWTYMEAAGAVFLPAAGYRNGTTVSSTHTDGVYWSQTNFISTDADDFQFSANYLRVNYQPKNGGESVRLVREVE